MRAVVLREHGGPEVLKVEEIPTPTPGPGEVRVRVRACALNHLDIWVRRGIPGAPFHLPTISGADISGEVDALGAETWQLDQKETDTPIGRGNLRMVSGGLS